MEEKYTSLKFSKKLKKAGCKLESKKYYVENFKGKKIPFIKSAKNRNGTVQHKPIYKVEQKLIKKYDIMNDICCKYAKEFFGKEKRGVMFDNELVDRHHQVLMSLHSDIFHPQVIMGLLREGKKPEAEEYMWKYCLFNPKNKKGE